MNVRPICLKWKIKMGVVSLIGSVLSVGTLLTRTGGKDNDCSEDNFLGVEMVGEREGVC